MRSHDREKLDQEQDGRVKSAKSPRPDSITRSIRELQATAGNKAVSDLIGHSGPTLQRVLSRGAFGVSEEWLAKQSSAAGIKAASSNQNASVEGDTTDDASAGAGSAYGSSSDQAAAGGASVGAGSAYDASSDQAASGNASGGAGSAYGASSDQAASGGASVGAGTHDASSDQAGDGSGGGGSYDASSDAAGSVDAVAGDADYYDDGSA